MLHIQNKEDFDKYSQLAQQNPEMFWAEIAQSFQWKKKWDKVTSGDFNDLNIKWFQGAELNITENVLDRHLNQRPDKMAIIWEPNDPTEKTRSYTYRELHNEVCRFSHVLTDLGHKKGDRICFYMSMVPELLIGVLACARIGAVHSVVFAGFSAKALAQRLQDCKSTLLITNDHAKRGDKVIDLKEISDQALSESPLVKNCIVYRHTGGEICWKKGRDLWWHELIEEKETSFEAVTTAAEDPLFILYTSGSTGKPKGLVHTVAGYMVYAGYSFKNVFGTNDKEDVFWCTADIGWITGHTYLTYGPLLNGVTQVMFEGVPNFPDCSRFWKIVDKHKVTHFYTAPTAIRALEKAGLDFVKGHDLSSLKVLGTVGEPINIEAWQWYNQHIGKKRCPIVDTWWQTETGGIMISPLPFMKDVTPCFATLPLPGIEPILVDEKGQELDQTEAQGNLCIKKAWPSIARTIYNDGERYRETYFSTYPGKYFTGDGCRRNSNGHYRITGRVDDVLNVSGHRIGTAEVENALNEHPCIVESAVVGFPHEIKGQGIYAYVILCDEKKDHLELKKEVHDLINKEIGPIARPDKIQVVPGLPKTRSGKIMRRILRKLAEGETKNLGDISTLLNPEVVEEIKEGLQ